jgi:chromosome segregation ATPase
MPSLRKTILILFLLAGAGSALAAQANRSRGDGSTQDPLLDEIQALRAEIRMLATASIRTQVLLAGLQIQEQRVFTTERQLAEARNSLAASRMESEGERIRVRQLQDLALRALSQERPALEQLILESQAQIEAQEKRESQLRTQETELVRLVTEAQSRWTEFNGRINELESSLPSVSR